MCIKISRQKAVDLLTRAKIRSLYKTEREEILLDWWVLDEDDLEFKQLGSSLQQELLNSDEPKDIMDNKYNGLIRLALAQKYIGVKNSYIEKVLEDLSIGIYRVKGEIESLYSCPCCEFKTLKNRDGYEICPVCKWEDTGDDLSAYSGPNHMTLLEGKKKINKDLLSHEKSKWFK